MTSTKAAVQFIPAKFEPSIFGGLGELPNTDWCLWYAYENNTGIVQAHTFGIELLKQLNEEPPRTVDLSVQEPALIVLSNEFRKAGIKRGSLSLAWVIYRKYTQDTTWEDAHQQGIAIINNLPNSSVKG